MGVIAEGIPRGCQGLFTPVSLGYPLSVFNKNSTLKRGWVREYQRWGWMTGIHGKEGVLKNSANMMAFQRRGRRKKREPFVTCQW